MSQKSEVVWNSLPSAAAVADALIGLYDTRGDHAYSEAVSQAQHAGQVGAYAMAARATDFMVAAAFLHDVGHLIAPYPGTTLAEDRDLHHELVGARFLANWFGPEITVPVSLHVPAKRYLCATEPGYFATLSAASVRSLGLQGGPMTDAEVAQFEGSPHAADAVALRRWDDLGKEPDAPSPSPAVYLELLAALAVPSSA